MSRVYCTPAEFTNWPTGLDVQDLVPDAPDAQQTGQLAVILDGASSYVNQLTYQPLYGRTITESAGDCRADGSGRLRVRLRTFPCTAVTAAQWMQGTSAGWQSISPTNIHVTGALQQGYYADDLDYRVYSGWGLPPFLVMTQFVAGYPNAVLTANVTAGATTLALDDATGIVASSTAGALTVPGTTLTIYDLQGGQEDVSVASVAGNAVTLAAGTLYGHAAGVRASALPPAVTQATIYVAAWMVKERRAGGGITMEGQLQPMDVRESEDLQMAQQLLQPFKRVV